MIPAEYKIIRIGELHRARGGHKRPFLPLAKHVSGDGILTSHQLKVVRGRKIEEQPVGFSVTGLGIENCASIEPISSDDLFENRSCAICYRSRLNHVERHVEI